MNSPVANRSIVDLGATVQKHKDTPKAILVMHALSGADTKQLALNALETTNPEQLFIAGEL